MNPKVDTYLNLGCGRCKLFNTPQCKVHTWHNELIKLREIVLSTELVEDYKWSQPCYTLGKSNVLIVTAFKESCVISFLKGALIKDDKKVLTAPGENSQFARWIKFTSLDQIIKQEKIIKAYINQAIEIEKQGLKVEKKSSAEIFLPEELISFFKNDKPFEKAFKTLTPGRQRGYLLFFTAPKNSVTKVSRIEKYYKNILEGKGMMD